MPQFCILFYAPAQPEIKKKGGLNFFAMVKAYANRKVLGKL